MKAVGNSLPTFCTWSAVSLPRQESNDLHSPGGTGGRTTGVRRGATISGNGLYQPSYVTCDVTIFKGVKDCSVGFGKHPVHV